jgi:hypothetical protein
MKKQTLTFILVAAFSGICVAQSTSQGTSQGTTTSTQSVEQENEAARELRAIKEFEAKIEANKNNINDYEGERARLNEKKAAYFKKYGIKPE